MRPAIPSASGTKLLQRALPWGGTGMVAVEGQTDVPSKYGRRRQPSNASPLNAKGAFKRRPSQRPPMQAKAEFR